MSRQQAPSRAVVVYCRVSSDEQRNEGFSLDAQERDCRRFAESEGYEIVEVIRESSSARDQGRPLFNEMLQRIQRGHLAAAGIVAVSVDRLSRNYEDAIAARAVAALHFVRGSHADTPEGQLMLDIETGFARYYSNQLSRNVRRGIRERVEQGHLPTKAPIGYRNVRRDDGRSIVEAVPEQAESVRALFERYASTGESVDQILANMKREGLWPPPGVRDFSRTQVFNVLRNPFYHGALMYHGERHQGAHEPIIPLELWQRCQRKLDAKNRRPRHHRAGTALFAGWMRCALCGCQITPEVKIKKLRSGEEQQYVYYRCAAIQRGCSAPRVSEAFIEDLLAQRILDLQLTHEAAQALKVAYAQYREREHGAIESRIKTLAAKIEKLKRRARELTFMRADRECSAEEFEIIRRETGDELARSEAILAEVSAQKPVPEEIAQSVLELLQELPKLWVRITREERAEFAKFVCLNPTFDGVSLCATTRKPFDLAGQRASCLVWSG